jgi:hypothetical protein
MGTIISSPPPAKILSIYAVNGFTAITGMTTNELTGSVLVPAYTLAPPPGGVIAEVTGRIVKTGTNGTVVTRIYANTTNSLSGAILLGSTTAAGAANLFVQMARTLFIGESPVNTKTFQAGGAAYDDMATSTGAETSSAVDWRVDQYIILAVQNGSALDSTIGSGIILKIYK